MNVTKLKRMIAVYEAGSFRKASLVLGMSQPALTWSIRQLEEELNACLFDRGARGIRPTETCEKLIARARLIVREQDRMMAEVERLNRHQCLELGIHSSLLNDALARTISRFQQLEPQVSLRIREAYSSQLLEQLERGELDFAYCALPAETDDALVFEMEPVATLDYSVVARSSHPAFAEIAAGRPVGPHAWAQFDARNIVGAFSGMGDIKHITEASGHACASQLVRTSSMGLIKLLVLEGDYLGLVADPFVAEEIGRGRLKRLPGTRFQGSQLGFISIRGSYETVATRTFKALLRQFDGASKHSQACAA